MKQKIRKNRSWPFFYAMIVNDSEIEKCKESPSLYEIMNFTKKFQMILQEAVRVNCRVLYSRREKSFVFFSPEKWNLDPKLAKRDVEITVIKNRHAHHRDLMKFMENEDCCLPHPETGDPCTLDQFCLAEATRSDS
jgi:hypothetical protein